MKRVASLLLVLSICSTLKVLDADPLHDFAESYEAMLGAFVVHGYDKRLCDKYFLENSFLFISHSGQPFSKSTLCRPAPPPPVAVSGEEKAEHIMPRVRADHVSNVTHTVLLSGVVRPRNERFLDVWVQQGTAGQMYYLLWKTARWRISGL